MTASARTAVNGNSEQVEHLVTYGATVSIALVSTTDVNTCRFSIVSDSVGSSSFPTITDTGFGTATFPAPADPHTGVGWAFLVQTIVNEGLPTQNVWRSIVGVANTNGIVPICPDESTERAARLGWLKAFNQAINIDYSGLGDLGNGNVIIGSVSGNQIRNLAVGDVANAVATTDSRLSDARDPTTHGSDHVVGGSDPIPTVGVAQSGIAPAAPSNNTVLCVIPVTGAVFQKITNLQIDNAAAIAWSKIAAPGTSLSSYGIIDGVTTSDARLSDARTPTAHAASHVSGSDKIVISDTNVATNAAIAVSKLAAGGTANRVVGTADGATVVMLDPGAIELKTRSNIVTDINGYRTFEYDAVYCLQLSDTANQTVGTITESAYAGDTGPLVPGHWEEICIEVTVLTMAFDHGGAGGTLRYTGNTTKGTGVAFWTRYSPLPSGPTNSWNHGSVTEDPYRHFGPAWATDMGLVIALDHSGANDGDITVKLQHVTGTAWDTNLAWGTAKIHVRIFGGGRYS